MKHKFEKLEIWKKSRSLVKEVYLLTKIFPEDEALELISGIRKITISIPSKIAEACTKANKNEMLLALEKSIGSICRLETQLYLCNDLGFASKKNTMPIFKELKIIKKMILGFCKQLD